MFCGILFFMSVLVIRHALSFANHSGSPAFRDPEAALMLRGQQHASYLGKVLTRDYDIDVSQTPVGVSEYLRSQETAHVAGFQRAQVYPRLNEISHNLNRTEWRAMIAEGRLPQDALDEAEARLALPFTEKVLFSHGLLIACMGMVLGMPPSKRIIPKFCEVRELPIKLA